MIQKLPLDQFLKGFELAPRIAIDGLEIKENNLKI